MTNPPATRRVGRAGQKASLARYAGTLVRSASTVAEAGFVPDSVVG